MKKRIIVVALGAVVAVGVALSVMLFSSAYEGKEPAALYIDSDDTVDSVATKMQRAEVSTTAFNLLGTVRSYKPRTGRYVIPSGMAGLDLYRKLRNGQQDPVMMTVPSVRTLDRLAGTMARNLMLDSLTLINALQDKEFVDALGYNEQSLPALFIPDTYEVFWDISLDKLFARLQKENERFWTDERKQKAEALKLTPLQVSTLASIVDEETANNAEKPMIAGLYLNRLAINMPLQADPTIKVAVGDWSLRRILNVHLRTESPYNTYLHTGLTPGPIRVPSKAGIDAVLNRAQHDYLYMCAKEDFSGTHNFAVTYAEHLQNARRYINALNQRGIK